MPRIFPRLTATRLQATTYLLGIALFSIAFLVFLNSSISFVVTDIIGQKDEVGDAVGTLSFADELLALVACPLWGLISDRIGVKTVAVIGYCVIGVSLIGLVKSDNVYPELLAGRLVFSIGGAACTTMVTAVLPAMVAERISRDDEPTLEEHGLANGHARRLLAEERQSRRDSLAHGASPSVSSELTITQHRYASHSQERQQQLGRATEEAEVDSEDKTAGTSQLAGFVGLFTGAGALVALLLFLPIAAYFQKRGQSPADSLETSYYIVSTIAFCVAIFVFIGLRNLSGEEEKSFSALFQQPYDERTDLSQSGHLHTTLTPAPSYLRLLRDAFMLGLTDSNIFLGYVGGFVARASSVAISLFIPVFVNNYFIKSGLCKPNPGNLPDIKKNCEDAYILASALSGIAETAALICAPIFGWLGGKALKGHSEWPLLVASIVGVGGYTAFGLLRNPDAFHEHEEEGGSWAILAVILIGVSQIGSIVCSLGLLGRGINTKDRSETGEGRPGTSSTLRVEETGPAAEGAETAPLLPSAQKRSAPQEVDRSRLKGSIAGMYSFSGGAGILLLTKLGGSLFDSWTPGAPFFIMAIFNAVLLIAVIAVGVGRALLRWKSEAQSA